MHIIFNAYWEPLEFELPAIEQSRTNGGVGSILHWIRRMRFANGMRNSRFARNSISCWRTVGGGAHRR